MSPRPPLVICLAGAGSSSGRAMEILASVLRYLEVAGGYRPEDFAEASYRVAADGSPLAYTADDTTVPLDVSVEAITRNLRWFRRRQDRPLHLLGWSLGGVVLFDALDRLVADDPSWAGVVRALVTVSSPLLGSDLDGLALLGELAAGPVGADLARRAADTQRKHDVQAAAERLRGLGVRIVTLAAEEDAVVPPEDALLPAVGPGPGAIRLRPRRRPGAPYLEAVLGHGALPHDPVCWRQVLNALGPARDPNAFDV